LKNWTKFIKKFGENGLILVISKVVWCNDCEQAKPPNQRKNTIFVIFPHLSQRIYAFYSANSVLL